MQNSYNYNFKLFKNVYIKRITNETRVNKMFQKHV